jgi:arylformamidase
VKIYDISLTVTPGMTVWPGDPQVQLERVSKMEEGASSNVSRLSMSVHTGTHVDAPHHFVHGSETVEQLDLDALVGPAQVVEIPREANVIDAELVAGLSLERGAPRLLFKTRNSLIWQRGERAFQKDFVAIDASGAAALVELGIRLVAVDYLSVAPFAEGAPTHVALLKAGMVLLEGVDLSQVPAGRYTLVCLPLKLGGAEGAPARAVLMDTAA